MICPWALWFKIIKVPLTLKNIPILRSGEEGGGQQGSCFSLLAVYVACRGAAGKGPPALWGERRAAWAFRDLYRSRISPGHGLQDRES